jgi:hypothetical protein
LQLLRPLDHLIAESDLVVERCFGVLLDELRIQETSYVELQSVAPTSIVLRSGRYYKQH